MKHISVLTALSALPSPFRSNFRTKALLAALTLITAYAPLGYTADLTAQFDQKHETCLEQITKDADLAYEEAMIWRSEGGGRRAHHCEAMALFALGHSKEAAHRLDKLGADTHGGSKALRANYYSEAANFWLISNQPGHAYQSATKGLDLDKRHADLRIARARSYALLGRYDDAETDLISTLAFHPNHAAALRYRADARRQLGKLQEAKMDIETSLRLDPTSVETALVRGEIIEALRVQALAPVTSETKARSNQPPSQ